MKKLKFEHNLAKLIVDGKKTSTWRLFDDKDLTVGDEIELIDKVNPNKPETWKPIGTANITKIVEKQLGDIDESDTQGHEKYSSQEELLETFRDYYGSNVNSKTTVKIISFNFKSPREGNSDQKTTPKTHIDSIKLYADGGSRGNPGPSASGFVLLDMDDTILVDKGIYLGLTTNNQAEYQALKFGLEEAAKMHVKSVDVYMDSLLVINQMKGIFKVRNRDLWPIHEAIKKLAVTFDHISFTHVPRELNKLADAAVNRSLDEQASQASKIMP
ncbi:MAG TPA: reverse transcriptase-like protein [Candidatus Saccharimonadales bacterium]|nr:reverse transcriptase-like protein [Candidatus Saccharimonadales bacterium]